MVGGANSTNPSLYIAQHHRIFSGISLNQISMEYDFLLELG